MNQCLFTLPCLKNTLRLLALLVLASMPLLADAAAGRFLFISGPVQIIAGNGHARAAHRGDSFDQGETITTAAHTIAQIRMEDGNLMSVQPNTRLRIDQYSYHGHPQASDRNYISLAKGAFRSITGAISKDHYRITTPDATIGIRGTDHIAMYVPPGGPAAIPPGTYDKVNTGRTFLATSHGEIEIAPNQAGYVPSAAAIPHLLPAIPDFLKSSSTPPRNTAVTSNKQDSTAAGDQQDSTVANNKQDSAAASNKQDSAAAGNKQDSAAAGNKQDSAAAGNKQDSAAAGNKQDSAANSSSNTVRAGNAPMTAEAHTDTSPATNTASMANGSTISEAHTGTMPAGSPSAGLSSPSLPTAIGIPQRGLQLPPELIYGPGGHFGGHGRH